MSAKLQIKLEASFPKDIGKKMLCIEARILYPVSGQIA